MIDQLNDGLNKADHYLKRAVTNMAVCAQNVQTATTAVVKLAADLGSIYDIINAADPESKIFLVARQARQVINTAAYNAEQLSKNTMEVSALIDQVSFSDHAGWKKAFNQMLPVDTQIKQVSGKMLTIENQLFKAETVVKSMADLIGVAKAKNMLISDELIDIVTTADKDSTNAVELTLQASDAVLIARVSIKRATAALKL